MEDVGPADASVPPVATSAPPRSLRDLTWKQLTWFAVALLAVTVVGLSLVHGLSSDGWTQVGNEATQLNTAQRAPRERPLLGDANTSNQYGNEPSRHPGPVAWYLLAPSVRLLGPQLGGWLFGVLWNIAGIAVATWMAYRLAGARVAAVAFVAVAAAISLAIPGELASAFFQYLPVSTLAAGLIACLATARGDTVALLVALAAGSFVVQTATVPFPLVLLCGLTAVLSAWWEHRSGRAAWGHPRRDAILAVLLGLALWAAPLWDQLFETGNLGRLARAEIPHAGLTGIGTVLSELTDDLSGRIPLLVAAVLVFAVGVRRPYRWSGERSLALVVAATLVGAAITGMLLPADDVETTHVLWVPVVWVVLAVALAAVVLPDQALRPFAPAVGAVLAMAALVGVLPTLGSRPAMPAQDRSAMAAVNATLPDILDVVPVGGVRTTWRGGWLGGRMAEGLAPRLEAQNRPGTAGMGEVTEFPGTTLMVIPAELTPWQQGEVIASYTPEPSGEVEPDFTEQVDRYVRQHGPLVLNVQAEVLLADLVDGWSEELCLEDLLADPDQILDLQPDAAARLYGMGLVKSPVLPDDLAGQVNPWQGEQPYTILRLAEPEHVPGPLAFSTSSC